MKPALLRTFHVLLLAVLLFLFGRAQAQGEFNNWYFGDHAGLTFNTTPPSVLLNGQLNTSEGCATVSDSAGNLLFYTDGLNVWDRQHQLMPNGTGLLGGFSSVNAALVIKKPGSSDTYFVFTVDNITSTDGLRYSVVDMTANGGLGDITVKNVLLRLAPVEKLAWTSHPSGNSLWLVSHDVNSDVYCAFEVTAAGVNPTPVTTAIGSVINDLDMQSQLRFSPDGTRLATSLHDTPVTELMEFNTTTGQLSNLISLPLSGSDQYGLEFSADGSKLYVGQYDPNLLYQYDLSSGTAAGINASLQLVGSSVSTYLTGMQRGPDNKIYLALAFATHLAVINYPDSAGTACGFVDTAINLLGRNCLFNLPLPVGIAKANFQLLSADACEGEAASFSFTPALAGVTALWNFGDPASGAANTSAQVAPGHAFSAPGNYNVTLTLSAGSSPVVLTTQVQVHPKPVFSLPDTVTKCTGAPTALNVSGQSGNALLWSTGETTPTIKPSAPGLYWLQVTSPEGCTARDSVQVLDTHQEPVLGPDTTVCLTTPFALTTLFPLTAYQWSTGDTLAVLSVTAPGTYYIKGQYRGCAMLDTIVIRQQCALFIPNIITPNEDGTNDAFAISGLESSTVRLQVFNRWGQPVFSSADYRNSWNAEGLSDGIYYYFLEDRSTGLSYKGYVEVLR